MIYHKTYAPQTVSLSISSVAFIVALILWHALWHSIVAFMFTRLTSCNPRRSHFSGGGCVSQYDCCSDETAERSRGGGEGILAGRGSTTATGIKINIILKMF